MFRRSVNHCHKNCTDPIAGSDSATTPRSLRLRLHSISKGVGPPFVIAVVRLETMAISADFDAAVWGCSPLRQGSATDGRYLAVFLASGQMPKDAADLRAGNANRVWGASKTAVPPEFRVGVHGVAKGGLLYLVRHFNHGFRCTAEARRVFQDYVANIDKDTSGDEAVAPKLADFYDACAQFRALAQPPELRGYLGLFRDDAVPKRFVTDSASGVERLVASASGVLLAYHGLMREGWDRIHVARDVAAIWNSESCKWKRSTYAASIARAGQELSFV